MGATTVEIGARINTAGYFGDCIIEVYTCVACSCRFLPSWGQMNKEIGIFLGPVRV